MKILVDIFESIVESIRLTGTITGSNEISTGVYEITSENELSFESIIEISSIEYTITNITATGFTIQAETGLDFTGETWTALAPYYLYGHPKDISKVLNEKTESQEYKYKKYPLIALLQDFEENHSSGFDLEYIVPNLRIIILDYTNQTYDSSQRYDNTFRPILYPIYLRLLKGIAYSPDIRAAYLEDINHSKYDRLYWGVEGIQGNEQLIFDDMLDGIDININNLEILSSDNCDS